METLPRLLALSCAYILVDGSLVVAEQPSLVAQAPSSTNTALLAE